MPRKPQNKAEDTLAHLGTVERADLLSELLERHPNLRAEANTIAEQLLDDVDTGWIAEEVTDLITSIDVEELHGRAGKQRWGYVEPSEAAWELLEESIEEIRADMKRRFEVGMKRAAEKICQGIVLGLHEADHEAEDTDDDRVLGWAPDFPTEAAAWSLSLLLELYPQRQKRAAGNRVVQAIKEDADDWVEMLNRVVDKTAAARRGG